MVSPARHRCPIALLSDFGYRDHYTGVMKGVIASIAPEASVIDLTHGIPAQSVAAGAIALAQSWRFFPQETISLAVVRSEEHTSELQSRSDLVCRLLLE